MPRRKKAPPIDPAEIDRLKLLLETEEHLESDLRQEMQEIIKTRDRQITRELRHSEERNKRLVMWVGVTIMMLVIASFWIANLLALTTRDLSIGAKPETIDIEGAKENLTTTMDKVLKDLEAIKREAENLKSTVTSTNDSVFPIENKLP
ncbi:hypothetical protein COT94_04490 [Candidatus Falkowbacteria bacterium CG10_big_fil_rev_8_21_14_0_10_37_14]|uniref:Uncharacterized protein n=1 Tax=Candidatus Falkowbacteria bacterium CG10_big_fil_rev_8_21_14_0_10_37_14 TaxID=1974561 RepID=A0A2M6WS88_9BACT|nr:hypothetical protein [Candidatus Falkowbacteria bacterium]PIT95677.1 MAG: hypothetical protein COT94_04490 [Candidatus Falkowbacteria bacterium CG10_big_fil_rev_8_21_14_0_10_37_14]